MLALHCNYNTCVLNSETFRSRLRSTSARDIWHAGVRLLLIVRWAWYAVRGQWIHSQNKQVNVRNVALWVSCDVLTAVFLEKSTQTLIAIFWKSTNIYNFKCGDCAFQHISNRWLMWLSKKLIIWKCQIFRMDTLLWCRRDFWEMRHA